MWTQLKVVEYFGRQGQASPWNLSDSVRKPEDSSKESKGVLVREGTRELKVRSKSKREREK